MKAKKIVLSLAASLAVLVSGCGGGGGGGGGKTVPTYTVGGTVTGLSGTLLLQNNGGDDLTITSDGPFTFSTALKDGSGYNVTVAAQPTGQICTVANGSGTISGADVTNITVTCSTNTYTIGGTVTGLGSGKTLVLQNNGGDDLSITQNGSFTFQSPLAYGASYNVTVSVQPSGQNCFVAKAAGTVSGDVTDIEVTCGNHGTLDPSFGTNGVAIHSNAAGGNGNDTGRSIVYDWGRTVVAGDSTNSSGDTDMVIWAYTDEGMVDSSFGKGGLMVLKNSAGGSGDDHGYSVVTTGRGFIGPKYYVTGDSTNKSGNLDMVIWAFNSDGTMDTSFGTDGIVVHNNAAGGNGHDTGYGIVLSAAVVVAGKSATGGIGSDMVIWKYDYKGSLDSGFGNNGIVVQDHSGFDYGFSLTTDPNQNLLVTGCIFGPNNLDMIIWRYTSSGSLDTTFGGGNGYVTFDDNAADKGYSVITDSNGNILATGETNDGNDFNMIIWKYDSTGNPDTTFGNDYDNNGTPDGYVFFDSGATDEGGYSITMDSSGNILVAGYTTNVSGDKDITVWRYTSTGSPDTTFGEDYDNDSTPDGYFIYDGGSGDDIGRALTIDYSGRILVTGETSNGSDSDMIILRLIP